jgi:isoleucyl-tRNA synthetase
LFLDLNKVSGKDKSESIHLSTFPVVNRNAINKNLEEQMQLAQKISSMILSIRKKENIKVRQPLNKIQIPVLNADIKSKIETVKDLILAEVNVKELDFVDEKTTSITKNLKLNFKTLGKKCGKHMKAVQNFANDHAKEIISGIESKGKFEINIEGDSIELITEDTEIIPVDIPGWKVSNSGSLTVALDITITENLKSEGIARELINRVQNLRKDKEYYVTDKITLKIKKVNQLEETIQNNLTYICNEILASSIEFVDQLNEKEADLVDLDEDYKTLIEINKLN